MTSRKDSLGYVHLHLPTALVKAIRNVLNNNNTQISKYLMNWWRHNIDCKYHKCQRLLSSLGIAY